MGRCTKTALEMPSSENYTMAWPRYDLLCKDSVLNVSWWCLYGADHLEEGCTLLLDNFQYKEVVSVNKHGCLLSRQCLFTISSMGCNTKPSINKHWSERMSMLRGSMSNLAPSFLHGCLLVFAGALCWYALQKDQDSAYDNFGVTHLG